MAALYSCFLIFFVSLFFVRFPDVEKLSPPILQLSEVILFQELANRQARDSILSGIVYYQG